MDTIRSENSIRGWQNGRHGLGGARERTPVVTVAILAQGTTSGDALCAALFYVPSVRAPRTTFSLKARLGKGAPALARSSRRSSIRGPGELSTRAPWRPGSELRRALSVRAGTPGRVGAFLAVEIVTVAILAQGTNSGDALCAALFYVAGVRAQRTRLPP